MFKENITPNIKKAVNNGRDFDIEKKEKLETIEMLNWGESDDYIANMLIQEESEKIDSIFKGLIDERGNFQSFLNQENIDYFSEKMSKIAKNISIQKLTRPDYSVNSGEATFNISRVLSKIFYQKFEKNINQGKHDNLPLLSSWMQIELDIKSWNDEISGDEGGFFSPSFNKLMKNPNISVLEEIQLQYFNKQINQTDRIDEYFVKIVSPGQYDNFRKEQTDINWFKKDIPKDFKLAVSLETRQALLLDKFDHNAFSEDNKENSAVEQLDSLDLNLIFSREDHGLLKSGFSNPYRKSLCDTKIVNGIQEQREKELFNNFRSSDQGLLLPCHEEIKSTELSSADGEFLVSDFSPKYDGIYSVSGNLEAFVDKNYTENGGVIKTRDFAEVQNEINFYNKQDIASFKLMSSLFFRDALEKKCGINIAELNLRTQYQFLNFIRSYSEDKFTELKKFMDTGVSAEAKTDRLKSFLCLELDKNLGNQIILLGEKLNPKLADMFFSKVAMINDLASKEEAELGSLLFTNNENQNFSGLKSEFLKKARDLVLKFSAIDPHKLNEKESENIFEELEKIKTEMVLLSGVLKSAKESGQKISLDMIKDLNLEKKEISQDQGIYLSEEEKALLLEIAKENYQAIFLDKKKNYNPKAYNRVISDFGKELNNLDGQIVYTLKYKNNIVCFNRFKKLSPYEVYGASLNVSKDVQGLSVGNSFIEQTLNEISQSYDIRIHSRQDNPANNAYQRQGFIVVGEYKEDDGIAYYDMIKPAAPSGLERAA